MMSTHTEQCIAFRFDVQKSMEAIAFFLEELGAIEKVKLTKLLYLADKAHFLRTGVPITGDRQVAMKHGPAPSATLDVINGEMEPDLAFRVIHTEDHWVFLRSKPLGHALSESERDALRQVVGEHGHKEQWQLVEETHRLPEYLECYEEGVARPISYETIARCAADDARFRSGRMVISPEASQKIEWPFRAGSDSDL